MLRFLRLNATTRADRQRMIAALRDAVIVGGGWITDVKFFSNVSLCLNFEIALADVTRLRDALGALDLSLSDESARALQDAAEIVSKAREDVRGTLQITFVHNEPDWRIEVPAIPG